MAKRVIFFENYTYKGRDKFRFMIDYRAGDALLVPDAHAAAAVAAGVAEYVEIDTARKPKVKKKVQNGEV